MRLLAVLFVIFLFSLPSRSFSKGNREYASELRKQLVEKIMPYWHATTIDTNHGGYILADDAAKKVIATEKQLVSQARMVWGFSHAAINKLGGGERDYLSAAAQGFHFLTNHFRDSEFGGYFWTTGLEGKPRNRSKIVYGQAFVIYGCVEYYRASGDKAALKEGMDMFRVLQEEAYDRKHGGWIEHFQRDWTPILTRGPEAIVEVGGLKSANTHLHLMEAFAELYEVTRDPSVRRALIESLEINKKHFYPRAAGESCFHRHLDWKPVTDPSSAGLSYGHNVEFAWLMIRAEQVLRRNPSWRHFYAHLDHALKYGYDHQRGGLYSKGVNDLPATDTDKVWWVQSELLAALTDALVHREDEQYSKALNSLLDFIVTHQADRKDGIWLDTVRADGTPKSTGKAHNWKANYHDVRALVKFTDAFGSGTAQ